MFTSISISPVVIRSPLKFLIQRRWSSTIKRIELYNKCYLILGVNENSDQNTVRRAYIDLVKKVHPDSGQPEASEEQFKMVDDAFKVLQEKFAKNRRGIYEDEEEKVYDIRHTAPQHRQFLSFDGIGVGNPFQRQKQYQQVKAMKAQERVLNHRIDKAQAGEKTLMKKGGTYYKNHAIKTKYGFDRVVEDLIQEAMSKGDFDNLSCAGKPLTSAQSQNPYLDFTTAKLNKILLDNGFTPEWITLQRDIREQIQQIKSEIAEQRTYFGDYPLNDNEQFKWNLVLSNYKNDVERINKNIDKFNLIVPILEIQLFRLNLEKLGNAILKDDSIPRNRKRQVSEKQAAEENSRYKKQDLFSFISSLF